MTRHRSGFVEFLHSKGHTERTVRNDIDRVAHCANIHAGVHAWSCRG